MKTINIEKHLGLVHLCCQRFKNRCSEYDEIFQCGCVGLIKASKNFDELRNIKFSTYAVPFILGEIKAFFRDNNLVKIGRSLKELSLKIKKFQEKFSSENHCEPSIGEICNAFKIQTEEVLEALEINKPIISLDDENQGNNRAISACQDEKISFKVSLENAIKFLNQKDKMLFYLRFFKFETQTTVAKKLGMTQVQVSRREKVLINLLRKNLI